MEASSQVEEVPDDAGIMDKIYHFKSIEEVERQEKNKCLDVVGVVESVDAWQTIQTRAGSETQKRAVYLRDDTGRSVGLPRADPRRAARGGSAAGPEPHPGSQGGARGRLQRQEPGHYQLHSDRRGPGAPPRPPAPAVVRQRGGAGGSAEPWGGGGGGGAPPPSPWGPSRRRRKSWGALGRPRACVLAPTSPTSAPSPSRTRRARCPLTPRRARVGAPATRSACPSGKTTRPARPSTAASAATAQKSCPLGVTSCPCA